MVHGMRSSMPTSSWTSSTTYKFSRRIPVRCSASVWGCHIRMYLGPSRVHSGNRILCSTHQGSPFRVFLSKFAKFLTKECSLVWPLPSRMIPTIMLFHICCNEVIRFRVVDVFISARYTSALVTIGIVVVWSRSRSNTCSSTSASSYILIWRILLWDFL